MGAAVFFSEFENKCGYTFIRKRVRSKRAAMTPIPYSKINSVGEEIVLSDEEKKDWVKAYHQAKEELGKSFVFQSEEVYHKVEEILKRSGDYRFL